MNFRHFLGFVILSAVSGQGLFSSDLEAEPPAALIGYTQLRTNLPGGRYINVATMRAAVIQADGANQRCLADELSRKPDTWTQFAGWSPDGSTAILGRGWESAENGKWEEEHKTFRFAAESYLYDCYLFDLKTGQATNVTAIERVSFHNTGLFFWPNDPGRLGFQALIDGNSHPFSMDRSGEKKCDLTKESREFAYGFSASPDGKRVAYHKNYQVYLANADGSDARQVKTGQPFNFVPKWSPDGAEVLFLSGEHYNCHPYLVRADGSGLRKLADRGGYRGVIEFLDVPDFHGGSSDVPVWSADGRAIFFTAQENGSVELFRVTREGTKEQLSKTPLGTLHYHPLPSPDGKWLVYGSQRDGVRQLYLMQLDSKQERRLTNLTPGSAAMWPHWQPR